MSKLLEHLKELRRCAMAHGMSLLDEDGVLEEVGRRRIGDKIIDVLLEPNPDEQTVLGRLTPEQYARAVLAERKEYEQACRRVGWCVMVMGGTAFALVIGWLVLRFYER